VIERRYRLVLRNSEGKEEELEIKAESEESARLKVKYNPQEEKIVLIEELPCEE